MSYDKTKAREFFSKGKKVAHNLQYDYAIGLYLDGLAIWPEALEEGHQVLREIALLRCGAGQKKSGFLDKSYYKRLNAKTYTHKMLKAEYLLSKDPHNITHMQEFIKESIKGDHKQTAKWMADVLFDAHIRKTKPSFQTFIFLRDTYTEIEVFDRALQACKHALQLKPQDADLQKSSSDLSVQTTMQKGKYDSGSDFRESMNNRKGQEERQSQENLIQSKTAKSKAILDAKQQYEAAPQIPGKISTFVNVLCSTETQSDEDKAIAVLEKAFNDLGQFQYQKRLGEIRIKQLNRQHLKLQKKAKNEARKKLREVAAELLKVELDHYRLCIENYPTDLRIKFEYAKRIMQAKEYNAAIPLFQETRNDPRLRIKSSNCIGKCFFYKKWYVDAIETFRESLLDMVDNVDETMAKEIRYNLGLAYEENGDLNDALTCFRKISQIDFNYLDVCDRIDQLRSSQE